MATLQQTDVSFGTIRYRGTWQAFGICIMNLSAIMIIDFVVSKTFKLKTMKRCVCWIICAVSLHLLAAHMCKLRKIALNK